MIYLDYNATAPMKPAVRSAMMEAMERHGNPSSVHRYGRIMRRQMEEARSAIAAFVGVKPAQIIFTSSGTEANNMVVCGADNIVTSSIEHDSILVNTSDAYRIPATVDGVIDIDAADEIFKSVPANALISVMMVNNETGVIQPMAEIARLARKYGHRLHTDAVQAAGRVPIDFNALGLDYLTLSAHKIGGPQGVGALIIREGAPLVPFICGGGQEMRRRAGTENVAGIAGFGIGVKLAADDLRERPTRVMLRDDLQKRLQAIGGEDAPVIGANAPRVGNTLCIAMRGVSSETQVAAMDLAGVAVSAGAACSSGKVKASHVLRAMGFADDIAGSALRISLGWNTQAADIDRCVDAWRALYERKHTVRRSAAA
jgi:cysteine desulfurase